MCALPMKNDPDFFGHNQKAFESSAEDVRNFVADIERLEQELADVNRDKRDAFTVMKSKGYNVKALRKVIAQRKRDAAELAEEDDAVQMYLDLLGR